VLTGLQPRGGQAGKAFTLTLEGRDLTAGAKIITTLPAIFTPLTPGAKGFPFLVELKKEAASARIPCASRLPTESPIFCCSQLALFPRSRKRRWWKKPMIPSPARRS
jgi:hypothetical protein